MEFIDRLFGTRAAHNLRQTESPGASSAWRCVEIKTSSVRPCAAARALIGRRFLPEEIPELPLPGCSAETCSCSYELHRDRRRQSRRPGPAEDPGASLPHRED